MTPNTTPRKMPTTVVIYAHWGERLGTPDKRHCMACKLPSSELERAHILSRRDGGGDEVENLLLLCPTCHKHQEFLSGAFASVGRPADGGDLAGLLELAANDAEMMKFRRWNSGSLLPFTQRTPRHSAAWADYHRGMGLETAEP